MKAVSYSISHSIYRRISFIFILCLTTSLFTGCGSRPQSIARTGFYFDTVIKITLYDTTDEKLLDDCFFLAEKYENLFSKTIEGSDVWNINHGKGQPVPVSEDTLYLLNTALYYADLTDGQIDPTIGGVSKLWHFTDTSSPSLPDSKALANAAAHVNYHNILIEDNRVTLTDPRAELDLGFIAKGYIADQMKAQLVSAGVDSAVINLGGNVLTIGTKPDGSPFKIGIQKPFAKDGTSALALPVENLSVVSSGIYERYLEIDGKIYHHILDTKTGYPVRNNLYEVTVLSPSSLEGDALSTTCFILGLDQGMALIDSLANTEAVFITSDGALHYSEGLATEK